MYFKFTSTVLHRNIGLILNIGKKKPVWVGGIGNRCEDGLYVLFIDYDGEKTFKEWVEEEILLLQKEFPSLGTAHLFKTANGFHVVFLEKFPIGTICKMLEYTSCDKNFQDVPLLYGRKIWVLRHTAKGNNKVNYITSFSRESSTEKSLAHALFLNKKYATFIPTNRNFDKLKNIVTATYKAGGY